MERGCRFNPDQIFEIKVGGGYNVVADHLSDLERGFDAGSDCYLDGGNVAAKPYRDHPGADLRDGEQLDLG